MKTPYSLIYLYGGVLQGGRISENLDSLKQDAFEAYKNGFDGEANDCYIMDAEGCILFNMDTDEAQVEADDYYAENSVASEASQMAETYGYWNEHPNHAVSAWQDEVKSGNTKAGYWEWVVALLSADARI